MFRSKKQYTEEEVLAKLMRYCAFQERSPQEVLLKAQTLGLNKAKAENCLDELVDEKFVDELRFAKAFVRGKSKIKRWGKYKILEGLRSKGINSLTAEKELSRIPKSLIRENLDYWIDRKQPIDQSSRKEKDKLYRFLISKGYESEQVSEAFRRNKLM